MAFWKFQRLEPLLLGQMELLDSSYCKHDLKRVSYSESGETFLVLRKKKLLCVKSLLTTFAWF